MGLIWLLILKYQNINRTEQISWIKSQLHSYGFNITDLTTSFQDGLAFAALVHSFKPDAIDLAAIKEMEILVRLDTSFRAAEDSMGIPRLLEPSDCYPDKPNERIIMTYLSFFHNVQRGSDAPRETLVAASTPDLKIVRSALPDMAELERLKEEIADLKNVKLEAATYAGAAAFIFALLILAFLGANLAIGAHK